LRNISKTQKTNAKIKKSHQNERGANILSDNSGIDPQEKKKKRKGNSLFSGNANT